jgi:hypothetical protein
MDHTRGNAAEEIKEQVSNVAEPVFNIVPEDVKKPHVAEDVEEPSVEKHGGQKRENLLKSRKMGSNGRIRVSNRNNAEEKKSFSQMGSLTQLPEKGKSV